MSKLTDFKSAIFPRTTPSQETAIERSKTEIPNQFWLVVDDAALLEFAKVFCYDFNTHIIQVTWDKQITAALDLLDDLYIKRYRSPALIAATSTMNTGEMTTIASNIHGTKHGMLIPTARWEVVSKNFESDLFDVEPVDTVYSIVTTHVEEE